MPAERADKLRVDELDLRLEVEVNARLNLVRFRVTVARGTALDDIPDEDILALEIDLSESVLSKIEKNESRYPVSKVKGKAREKIKSLS